ncbi:uncharacterized protein LOC130215761 [Danio aesculapii]|uniref:uncharacterized protein LOC130215761 n=1 Tax=Danio aesculapii TaxID=1142201 RepID=UPI0024C0263F|nr:uncharacterized protein LOC130215761 [Danio aesculapii]
MTYKFMDEELKVAQKSSSPVRLPTSDQKRNEQDRRIFRQLRPWTLSPRDQATPADLSTFQPTPPSKREQESTQQHQKMTRASANFSSVSRPQQLQHTKEQDKRIFPQLRPWTVIPKVQLTPAHLSTFQPTPRSKRKRASANFSSVPRQPQLQQKRMSLKEKMEAVEKAWREETERREELKIEEVVEAQETNFDKSSDLKSMEREVFVRARTIKSDEIKEGFLERKTETLKESILLCHYRMNEALYERKALKKQQQQQQDPSWKIENKLMTDKLAEVYKDCGGIFNDADVSSKEKELEDLCLEACNFIKSHKFETPLSQMIEDYENRKMKRELAQQTALMKQKREEWCQYRRQKRLAIALAPPVVITGRKLMPRSPPPRPVQKEPAEATWKDSLMDLFD